MNGNDKQNLTVTPDFLAGRGYSLSKAARAVEVHPPRKLEVGTRMAAVAAATVYGKDTPYSGPVVIDEKPQGNSLVLSYKFGKGLQTTDGKAPRGFEVSANGKEYSPAEATIDGESIVLTSDKVKKPRFARYGWYTYMEPNLVNEAKLPASPHDSTLLKAESPKK